MEGVRFVEMQTDFPTLPQGLPGATLSTYVATKWLTQAAASAESPDPANLRTSLLRQKTVVTAGGSFAIRNRSVEFPMLLRLVRDGRVTTIADDSYNHRVERPGNRRLR